MSTDKFYLHSCKNKYEHKEKNMLNMNELDEMFNNKNRHEEFERENYAEIIEKNMNCKENENLINTFATMFAINSLKNIKPIYQVALYGFLVDCIKEKMHMILPIGTVIDIEKNTDYETNYKDTKSEYEKNVDRMNSTMEFFILWNCIK